MQQTLGICYTIFFFSILLIFEHSKKFEHFIIQSCSNVQRKRITQRVLKDCHKEKILIYDWLLATKGNFIIRFWTFTIFEKKLLILSLIITSCKNHRSFEKKKNELSTVKGLGSSKMRPSELLYDVLSRSYNYNLISSTIFHPR